MLGAVMFGHKHFQPVIEAIIRLAEKAAKEPRDYQPADVSEVEKAVLAIAEKDLREAYKLTQKQDRYTAVDAVKAKVMAELVPADGEAKVRGRDGQGRPSRTRRPSRAPWTSWTKARRIDGRDVRSVRPIVAESACCRGPTDPRSSLAARRRPCGRDPRHGRGRAVHSTRVEGTHRRTSSCTTTPALLGGRRPAAGLARAPAKSAMAARLARHPPDAAAQP
jgi:hypothetical protein